jgi:hypothetical protein
MITIIATVVGFLGGVYVGARYGESLRAAWYSIFKS